MQRLACALTLTLAFVALSAAPAFAAGWTPAVALQPSSPGTAPSSDARMAVNSAGDQVMIWADNDSSGSDAPSCAHDEAVTRTPGGDWSPSIVVPCGAQVAIGSGGGALVFWDDPTASAAMAATAQAGSRFRDPVVADSASATHSGVTGAVDPQGIPTIAWTAGTTYGNEEVQAKTANADGTWPASAAPQSVAGIATGRVYGSPALAIGPLGDAVIAVTSSTYISPTTTYSMYAESRTAGSSSWGGSALIVPVTNYQIDTPQVVFDAQDRPTVMVVDGYSTFELSAWSRPAGAAATWSAHQVVEGGTTKLFEFAAAVDGNGLVQTAYTYNTGTEWQIHAATRPAYTGPPAPPWSTGTVFPGCAATVRPPRPSAVVDAQNNALIGFTCGATQYTYQRLAGSSTYGAFTGPAGATGISYTTDPNGYVIATWIANGITYTSIYDAVPPAVDNFSPPSAPVAGQPASFSVNGSDVWGPVTFSIDFGDGSAPATGRVALHSRSALLARATVASTVSHTYGAAGNYRATITVNDSAGNSATSTTPVAVAAASGTGPVIPPITGLPDPVAGQTVNIFPVKPVVLVKEPGATKFVPLTAPKQVRVGSIIDARHGRVRITIANGKGGFDTADFYLGEFKIVQPLPKTAALLRTTFADLLLYGGNFKGCARAPKAQLSRKRLSKTRKVRKLWGSGTGAFRTVGRYSSATIRGTTWLTQDQCNGTLTRVTAGKVAVRDFVRRKTIVVKARHKYFAAARKKR